MLGINSISAQTCLSDLSLFSSRKFRRAGGIIQPAYDRSGNSDFGKHPIICVCIINPTSIDIIVRTVLISEVRCKIPECCCVSHIN